MSNKLNIINKLKNYKPEVIPSLIYDGLTIRKNFNDLKLILSVF